MKVDNQNVRGAIIDGWKPIEEYELPPFIPEKYFMEGPAVLIWNGNWPEIANYGYTKKGVGRWRGRYGNTTATHFFVLPQPPAKQGA